MADYQELKAFYVREDASEWVRLGKEELFEEGRGISDWGMDVLQRGLGGFVGTILLEHRYICKDHRNLFSNFYSKKTHPGSSHCARLHFFEQDRVDTDEFHLNPKKYEAGYIGFSIIRDVPERCLGRTVIDPSKLRRGFANGCYLMRAKYRTNLNGRKLTVEGYPYMAQDAEATVCAHASLWGVCRYLSERYSSYAEMLPYDLVKLTGPARGRVVPYRGMTYEDYSRILAVFGCHPEVFFTKDTPEEKSLIPERLEDLCCYVESGIPILASFGNHVVALIGHTLDPARCDYAPESGGLVSSSSFLKQFIIMDDNFPPYQLLAREGEEGNYGACDANGAEYTIQRILTAVCPLPEKVFLPSHHAREFGLKLLRKFIAQYGRDQFEAGHEGAHLVYRLFVTSGSSWKRRKLEAAAPGAEELDDFTRSVISLPLPHFIWVLEISPLPLYQKGRATGEIILDATAHYLDNRAFIYARAGARLLLEKGFPPLENASPDYQQYTHNLGEAP